MPKVIVRKHQSAPKPKKSGPEDVSLIPRGPPLGKWDLTQGWVPGGGGRRGCNTQFLPSGMWRSHRGDETCMFLNKAIMRQGSIQSVTKWVRPVYVFVEDEFCIRLRFQGKSVGWAVEEKVSPCKGSRGAFQIWWNDNAKDTKELCERCFWKLACAVLPGKDLKRHCQCPAPQGGVRGALKPAQTVGHCHRTATAFLCLPQPPSQACLHLHSLQVPGIFKNKTLSVSQVANSQCSNILKRRYFTMKVLLSLPFA